jgi:hypothetical protein
VPTIIINLSEEDVSSGKARRMMLAEDAYACLHEVDNNLRLIQKHHDVGEEVGRHLSCAREIISDVMFAGEYL